MLRATLKSVLAHKLRLGLTGLAIVLGVGFVAGTFVLTDTLNAFFEEVFTDASRFDISVRAKQTATGQSGADRAEGVPVELLDTVKGVPGVAEAEGLVGGYAQFIGKDGKPVGGMGPPTLGFSWSDNETFSPLTLREGAPPRAPNEVVMDVVVARNEGFRVGEKVRIQFVGPAQEFTIVGLTGFGEADNLGGATLAVFERETAHKVLDSVGRYDSVAVGAEPGVAVGSVLEDISDVLPPRFEAVTAQAAAQESADGVKEGIAFFGTAILFFAGIALFVGAFVIANTFSIVVAQRTRELALLRALGATGGQVMRSVVLEAALVGAVASVIGLGFGIAVGLGLRELVQAVGGGAELPGAGIRILPRTVYVAVGVGMTVAIISSIAPARRASRLSPVAAMRETTEEAGLPAFRRSAFAGIAAVIGVVLLGYGMFGRDVALRFGVIGLGTVALFLGLGLLAPFITKPLASVLAWPLPRLAGVAGRLARANATRNPGRTAATAVALMVGLALVSSISLLTASMKASVSDLLDDIVRADYIVRFGGGGGGPGGPLTMSPEVSARLRARPEVAHVVAMRIDQWSYEGKTKTLAAISPDGVGQVMELGMESGNTDALADGGVLLHTDIAEKLGLGVGESLAMTFPVSGTVQVPIDGVYRERRISNTGYLLSMVDYERGYTTRGDALAFVKMRSPDKAAFNRVLKDVTGEFPNLIVQDQQQFKAQQTAQLDQLLALVTALLGLAIIIALLGIANTLALSIFERTRELGLLRAVGMSRRQVRRMVHWEAVLIAVFGAVLGVAVGVVFGLAAVRAMADDGINKTVVPGGQLIVLVVLAGLAGLGASAFPARRAGRLDILAAIAND